MVAQVTFEIFSYSILDTCSKFETHATNFLKTNATNLLKRERERDMNKEKERYKEDMLLEIKYICYFSYQHKYQLDLWVSSCCQNVSFLKKMAKSLLKAVRSRI